MIEKASDTLSGEALLRDARLMTASAVLPILCYPCERPQSMSHRKGRPEI